MLLQLGRLSNFWATFDLLLSTNQLVSYTSQLKSTKPHNRTINLLLATNQPEVDPCMPLLHRIYMIDNTLNVTLYHFELSATEFCDSLALRYNKLILKAPAKCDGCGDVFNMTHALDCRKGGHVIQLHNEVRDALGDLASLVYKDVIREPIVVYHLWLRILVLEGYDSLRRLRCLICVSLTLTLRRICTGMLPLSYRPLKKKRRENTMMQQKHGVLHLHH